MGSASDKAQLVEKNSTYPQPNHTMSKLSLFINEPEEFESKFFLSHLPKKFYF